MKTEPNQPINAFVEPNEISGSMNYGLTKREYFAAMALQGILASPFPGNNVMNAKMAVEQADELIQALNK